MNAHEVPTTRKRRRRVALLLLSCAVWLAWCAVAGPAQPAGAATSGKVTGIVRDTAGAPVADAPVSISSSSEPPVRTDSTGRFTFTDVPAGERSITVAPVCKPPVTLAVAVDGNEQRNVTVQERNLDDSFGYACRSTRPGIVSAFTGTGLSGDDAAVEVPLPFGFPFYGTPRTKAFVSTNGFLSFTSASTAFTNTTIPDPAGPNAAIYAFWDDLVVDGQASVRTDSSGQAPFRVFSIKWSDVRVRAGATDTRISTEIRLFEDGAIEIGYAGIGSEALEQGASATMGIEDDSGTVGVQQSSDRAHLLVTSDSMVRYEPNRDPIADAGEFFGTAKPGATLPLDGTQSVDLDGDVLRYAWRQVSGPATAIADATSPKTTAKAPAASVAFEVRVVDSYGASDTDTVVMTVKAPK